MLVHLTDRRCYSVPGPARLLINVRFTFDYLPDHVAKLVSPRPFTIPTGLNRLLHWARSAATVTLTISSARASAGLAHSMIAWKLAK